MTAPSGPTEGRIVHYTGEDGRCVPGIVSEAQPDALVLTIFPITGPNVVTAVDDKGGQDVGSWHWPERA